MTTLNPLDPKLNNKEKEKQIQRNFDQIASTYDYFNDLISFGLHRIWKKKMIRLSKLDLPVEGAHSSCRVIDLCCGTGDLTLQLVKILPANAQIEALDYSNNMIFFYKKNGAN